MISICPRCKAALELNPTNFYPNKGQRKRQYDYQCIPCRKIITKGSWGKVSKEAKSRKNESKKYVLRSRANSLMAAYRKYDKKHNMNFDLTRDIVMSLLSKKCVYCDLGELHKLGLDRIDNSKGHLISNVVTCCDECNTARSDHFSFNEMMIIGEAIKIVRHDRRVSYECPGNMPKTEKEEMEKRAQKMYYALTQ